MVTLHGCLTALITPFRNDAVDAVAFKRLVEWQIAEGIHGLVPCGTTGESPTLSHAEHKQVVDLCVSTTNGRVPVVAGTGSNATSEAIDLTRHAKAAGADAALVVTPYYNKPTQEGLYRHYATIAEAVDIPIVIYNIPARSVVDMSVDTMARLARNANIVGVKDATADLLRPLRTTAAIGTQFAQLSGEDATALAHLAQGGVGCISVSSNVAPKLCSALQTAWAEGRLAEAMRINLALLPLHEALFCETNPGPVKYAASLLGHGTAETRLPLVPIADASAARVAAALRVLGLIS